jgi:hypothetical protein
MFYIREARTTANVSVVLGREQLFTSEPFKSIEFFLRNVWKYSFKKVLNRDEIDPVMRRGDN